MCSLVKFLIKLDELLFECVFGKIIKKSFFLRVKEINCSNYLWSNFTMQH